MDRMRQDRIFKTEGAHGQDIFRGDVSCQTHFFGGGGGGWVVGGLAKLHLVGALLVEGRSLPCPKSGRELAKVAESVLFISCDITGGSKAPLLTGFNRIAIHFPCVGSWMAPGQGSLWLI